MASYEEYQSTKDKAAYFRGISSFEEKQALWDKLSTAEKRSLFSRMPISDTKSFLDAMKSEDRKFVYKFFDEKKLKGYYKGLTDDEKKAMMSEINAMNAAQDLEREATKDEKKGFAVSYKEKKSDLSRLKKEIKRNEVRIKRISRKRDRLVKELMKAGNSGEYVINFRRKKVNAVLAELEKYKERGKKLGSMREELHDEVAALGYRSDKKISDEGEVIVTLEDFVINSRRADEEKERRATAATGQAQASNDTQKAKNDEYVFSNDSVEKLDHKRDKLLRSQLLRFADQATAVKAAWEKWDKMKKGLDDTISQFANNKSAAYKEYEDLRKSFVDAVLEGKTSYLGGEMDENDINLAEEMRNFKGEGSHLEAINQEIDKRVEEQDFSKLSDVELEEKRKNYLVGRLLLLAEQSTALKYSNFDKSNPNQLKEYDKLRINFVKAALEGETTYLSRQMDENDLKVAEEIRKYKGSGKFLEAIDSEINRRKGNRIEERDEEANTETMDGQVRDSDTSVIVANVQTRVQDLEQAGVYADGNAPVVGEVVLNERSVPVNTITNRELLIAVNFFENQMKQKGREAAMEIGRAHV